MPSKFDTNPLDPEFPQKAREAQTQILEEESRTNKLPRFAAEDEPTRPINRHNFADYNAPFQTAPPPAHFVTAKLNHVETVGSRKVAKVGLPENVLVALPYIPFFIGLVAGILELLFVPKSETKVRFHAAQGLAAHVGILIVTSILGIFGNLPGAGMAETGNGIFQIITTIMLFLFAVKAWRGKPVHIAAVDNLTEWLEEKIKPQVK